MEDNGKEKYSSIELRKVEEIRIEQSREEYRRLEWSGVEQNRVEYSRIEWSRVEQSTSRAQGTLQHATAQMENGSAV